MQKKQIVLDKKDKPQRQKKYIGSDCKHCSLQEGVYCMVYFCKLKSDKHRRIVCHDGFERKCPDYKKAKDVVRK